MKAKIKEKLFNRKDEVEVEEVSGELPESFKEVLLPFIQQNGIAFNKYYLYVGDTPKIVDTVPSDYTGIVLFFGLESEHDVYITFAEYINGEETEKYTGVSYDDINISNISFNQKATVWEVEDDFQSLDSWLDDNASKLKNGDIIYSSYDNYNGIVESLVEGMLIIRVLTSTVVIVYNYSYTELGGWTFDNQTSTPIGGTKLYKHSIVGKTDANADIAFSFISSNNTPITISTNMNAKIGDDLVSMSVETQNDFWSSLPIGFSKLGIDMEVNLGDGSYSITFNTLTDTVTPL